MLYIHPEYLDVTDEMPRHKEGWQSRWDWKSLEEVEALADRLTEEHKIHFIGIDKGRGVSPRFDIIEAPKLGDAVSYSFNGDSYVDGVISSISKSMKVITTSEGNRYYRVRKSGAWKMRKTWTLVKGHSETRNPHI